MPGFDGLFQAIASLEATETSAMIGGSEAHGLATAARRVYDTPELFQQITDYLSVKAVCGLLVLEKAFLWRGMQWIGRRGEKRFPEHHTGEVGPEAVHNADNHDIATLVCSLRCAEYSSREP